MSRSPTRRSRLASLPLLALGAAWPLSGQAIHAGIDYVREAAVVGGLSGAQLSYLAIPADPRVADSFRAVASRLHGSRERWDDAALLHVFAANLRGPADPKSLTDLLLAADLFSAIGESDAACAALQRAAAIAVRVGRLNDARYCQQRAKLTESSGCSRTWGALLTGRVVPAPGPVYVQDPDFGTARGLKSHLPAPPGSIIVDPPELPEPTRAEADLTSSSPILAPLRIARPDA